MVQGDSEEEILRKTNILKELVRKKQYRRAHELAWEIVAELARIRRESRLARLREILRKISGLKH